MNQVQDDEIDLIELFQTLWEGKWLISLFVAIAVLLGGGFLSLKDAVYESKLIFSTETLPPFYDADRASTDFQNKFYSASVFEEWKQNNSNTSLVFADFSATEVVDGFVLSKGEGDQLATIETENKVSFLLVKSNQLPILNDFFKYANHISRRVADEYVVRAKEDLKIIESRFKYSGELDRGSADTFLSIARYIDSAENKANLFIFQRPTMPKKVSPKVRLILGLSVVLGGMIGVFFILVRNAIRKRKEQVAEA